MGPDRASLLCRRAAKQVGKARRQKAQKPEQNLPVLAFRLERIVALKVLVDKRECGFFSRVRLNGFEQDIFQLRA
jgi:hypothetical protein